VAIRATRNAFGFRATTAAKNNAGTSGAALTGDFMTIGNRIRQLPDRCPRFRMLERIAPRALFGFVFIVAAALAPASGAQVLMTLGNASIFEGNSGTSILRLPVNFAGTNTSTVTGFASAVAISGTGFHPATPGVPGGSCGPGVDFIPFSNVAFTIPPNTPNGTLNVGVTICGDTTIEPDEQIFVTLTGVAGGAFCTTESCAAIGTIINDDGPPSMSINDIAVSEPAGTGSTKTAFFTVSLHHLTAQTVTAHFATSSCPLLCEFVPTSGTVTIPPNTLSGVIPVTIRNDGFLGSAQGFSMTLSSPTNATILDGIGAATIFEAPLFTPGIGGFELSPDDAIVNNGDSVAYDLVWTVPEGRTWHDLKSIDFRIGEYGNPVLWVKWDESSDTFSLCEKAGNVAGNAERDHDGSPPQICGPGVAPGSAAPLVTASAQLILAETTVVGSGPSGPSVALHLVVTFGPEIKAHSYPVEISVQDDFGNTQAFFRATDVTVE
jgi:hypothetical protein